MNAIGTFTVTLNPQDAYTTGVDGINLGRMSIDKTFSGDLHGISQGEMLSAMTVVKGSAGYVAIEQVTGTLDGRKGSFVLQHFGTMNQGQDRLVLEVVPDSASGELRGLVGEMRIRIDQGVHHYEFDYRLEISDE
ncbi:MULTISPECIES: DUF3224 domain-containing protein [unclassified Pseudoalteromonas]|uniref:DUF3224 domain-containing protein n=1 Tax=unclassified Pseudoalteromonas TaxID=194690 RepID=UPI000CF6F400|nr:MULTISPECIES: DUF3224 domain-containing protein [unclassified Pseudoalteromonas]MBS3799243.1 DUF3224 domain-containing protein [Pseudoalteromonas sp. BDTF-M6]